MEKVLGKIDSVYFGIGGYNDAMIGLHLAFSMQGLGVGTTISAWDAETIEWSECCKWTEESRSSQYADIMRQLSKFLKRLY